MSFQKLLIAVDEDPIAVHAAEVGMELARSLKAQIALIYAVDPALTVAPESGIAAADLAAAAKRDAERLWRVSALACRPKPTLWHSCPWDRPDRRSSRLRRNGRPTLS